MAHLGYWSRFANLRLRPSLKGRSHSGVVEAKASNWHWKPYCPLLIGPASSADFTKFLSFWILLTGAAIDIRPDIDALVLDSDLDTLKSWWSFSDAVALRRRNDDFALSG